MTHKLNLDSKREWLGATLGIGFVVLIIITVVGYIILDNQNDNMANTIVDKYKAQIQGLQNMVDSNCAEISPGFVDLLNKIRGENNETYYVNNLDECKRTLTELLKKQPDFLYQMRLYVRRVAIEEFDKELSSRGFLYQAADRISCVRAWSINRYGDGSATCPSKKVSSGFSTNR